MKEQQVALGRTDVRISPEGTGAWEWGDKMMWEYGQAYAEDEVRGAFDASLAAGIDFFDTAEVYGLGKSEKLLGQFIRESERHVVVATKFAPFPWRLRRRSVIAALKHSLDRLGLARVDLYQVHWPYSLVPIEALMDGLADAVEMGLTHAVGVSNYSAKQTWRAHAALARRGIPLASNQVEYSLLERKPETSGLVETCRELDVAIIAYSPLRKGLLTGKYSPNHPPPGRRRAMYRRDYLVRIEPLLDLIRHIGESHGKTPAQVALNWLLCKGAVPIPGAKNAQQVRDNAGALGWRLSGDEMAQLDAASLL